MIVALDVILSYISNLALTKMLSSEKAWISIFGKFTKKRKRYRFLVFGKALGEKSVVNALPEPGPEPEPEPEPESLGQNQILGQSQSQSGVYRLLITLCCRVGWFAISIPFSKL